MKIFGKKCSYCRSRFANHLNRKIHETMMHKEKLIRDGLKPVPINKDMSLHVSNQKKLIISSTPHIGSVECVIEPDKIGGTFVMNPSKKYPRGKVYVWSHVHEYCTRDPCLFCGRGDFKKEWGIEE